MSETRPDSSSDPTSTASAKSGYRSTAKKVNEAGSCDHCGALVYGDNTKCPQCGRFPIKMHQCPRCKSIAASTTASCWKCGRVFEPDGDFL